MRQIDTLESAIRQELIRAGTCTLDELNERLPDYSWTQVVSAVDILRPSFEKELWQWIRNKGRTAPASRPLYLKRVEVEVKVEKECWRFEAEG